LAKVGFRHFDDPIEVHRVMVSLRGGKSMPVPARKAVALSAFQVSTIVGHQRRTILHVDSPGGIGFGYPVQWQQSPIVHFEIVANAIREQQSHDDAIE
jgi:hypothetical protein